MRHGYVLFFLVFVLTIGLRPHTAYAQMGIGTTSPNAKAALDISATDKGLLIPRLDSVQRTTIVSPPDGLMVFQTTGRKGFWYAISGTWLYLPDKAKSGDNLGNHTATQNLNLGSFKLTGGGTVGLRVGSTGVVTSESFISMNDQDVLFRGTNASDGNHGVGWYGAGIPWAGFAVDGPVLYGNLAGVLGTRSGGNRSVLTWNNSGNVGIGTTSPGARLDVAGTLRVSGTSGVYRTYNFPLDPSPATTLMAEYRGTTGYGPLVRYTGAGAGSDFVDIGQNRNGDFAVQNSSGSQLTMTQSGNVGIGTTSPTATLEVAGAGSTVKLGGLAGTSTRVVTADATGNLSTIAPALLADNLGNHTATQNLALGANALTGTGTNIGTAVGAGVTSWGGLNLGQNTTGNNVYVGYDAGLSNTSGARNLLVGFQAGRLNNTGSDNTLLGYRAGLNNTSGGSNLFIGANAGNTSSTGSRNVYLGTSSGRNSTGNQNTFVGQSSGSVDTTGSNNWALGYNAGPGVNSLTNAGAIGTNAVVMQSNSLVLGGIGADAVSVGIGTPVPSATLEVAGATSTVKVGGLAGTGTRMMTADATGLLSSQAIPVDTDTDAQQLTKSGATISLTNGGSVTDSDNQNLSTTTSGTQRTISISGGTSTTIDVADNDNDTTNELQTISKIGSTVTLSNGGGSFTDTDTDTDAQTLSVSGGYLSISGGNSVALTSLDAQQLSKTGSTISLTNGGSVTDSDNQNLSLSGAALSISDGTGITLPDASATNELQTISKTGSTVTLSNGGGSFTDTDTDTDAQTLSISGSTISLTNGGSVTVPSSADNFGNHTATQNLQLGANTLTGNGGSTGLQISTNGRLLTTADNLVVGKNTGNSSLSGINNTMLGSQSGLALTSGSANTLTGVNAGLALTTGSDNTFIGVAAGDHTTTSGTNVALGRSSGTTNVTGTLLTLLGGGADVTGTALTNATAVGSNAKVGQSNSLVLGGTGGSAVNVGIGTTTPAATLHVAGTTTTVRLDGLASTGTRMVTADASGTLATQAIPVDTDAQQLTKTGSTISLTNGGSVTDSDNQNLSLSGAALNISGGAGITLPDASATNELQTISKTGNVVTLSNGGGSFTDTDTDAQALSISGGTISLTNGGSVTVPDASATNELQTISKTGNTVTLSNGGGSFTDTDTDAQALSISGGTISLTNGGTVTLPDADATNELQTISKTGNTVTLSNGGGSFTDTDTDAQTLSLSGQTLAISGGNSVTVPVVSATNGLSLTTGAVGLGGTLTAATTIANGGNNLGITGTGNVGIGTASPATKLDVAGGFKLGSNGTTLAAVIKATVNVNVPNVVAGNTQTVTFTVTNAQTTGTAFISPSAALANGLVIQYARVSAANTVEVKIHNPTGADINPAAQDYYLTVIQ